MISVTRLNKQPFYLNSDLIELIEEMPDTIITMSTGKRVIVEESTLTVVNKIIEFKNQCFRNVTVGIARSEEEMDELKKSLCDKHMMENA